MHPNRWRAGFVALSTFLVLAVPALAQDKVEVKVAKYDELAATIKKLKGKVIVIDFWADW
jgi:thiol:disulfide interchange protein